MGVQITNYDKRKIKFKSIMFIFSKNDSGRGLNNAVINMIVLVVCTTIGCVYTKLYLNISQLCLDRCFQFHIFLFSIINWLNFFVWFGSFFGHRLFSQFFLHFWIYIFFNNVYTLHLLKGRVPNDELNETNSRS